MTPRQKAIEVIAEALFGSYVSGQNFESQEEADQCTWDGIGESMQDAFRRSAVDLLGELEMITTKNSDELFVTVLNKKAYDEGVEDARNNRPSRFQSATNSETKSYIDGYEYIMGGDYIGSADDLE